MGELIRTHLIGAGGAVLTEDSEPPTPTALVTLDEQGQAHCEFAITWSLRRASPPRAGHVHLGSLASVMDPGAAHARQLLRDLRASGTTVS
jgi:fructokinase